MKFFCSSLLTVIMVQDRRVFFFFILFECSVTTEQTSRRSATWQIHCVLSLAVTVLHHFLLTTLLITYDKIMKCYCSNNMKWTFVSGNTDKTVHIKQIRKCKTGICNTAALGFYVLIKWRSRKFPLDVNWTFEMDTLWDFFCLFYCASCVSVP